jgi:hypothetical protein
MTGLPDTDVEIVALDGTQSLASVADVEFYVPSFFPTPAGIEAVGVPAAREQAEAYLRGDPLRM